MLKIIRKYSRSWFIWLAIGAIIAVFVLWGVGGFQSTRFQEVASVNGQPILVTAYQRQFMELVKQYQDAKPGRVDRGDGQGHAPQGSSPEPFD